MKRQSVGKKHGVGTWCVQSLCIGMLFLNAFVLRGTTREASAAEAIVPQTLFEVAYGQAEEQIGIYIGDPVEGPPHGPVGLAVGPSGDVYIADRVQGKVKRFDRAGNFLMATDGKIVNMGLPAVSPTREILVAGGAAGGTELTMFNEEGSRLTSARDEEGRLVGRAGADYVLAHISAWTVQRGLHWQVSLRLLYFDSAGRLYAGVEGTDFEPGVVGARQRVFVFSPDLRLTTVMLGDFVNPGGLVYSASSPGVDHIRQRFEVRAPDGSLLREVDIPNQQATTEILPWMGGENAGVWYRMADEAGNVYLIDAVGRVNVGESPFFLTERLRVVCDLSVVKIDPQGRLAAAFRLPRGPFSNSHSVFVDPGGDIYYFEFGPQSLTVKMITGKSLDTAAAKVPSKIVPIQ